MPHEHHICVGSHIFFVVDGEPPALGNFGPGVPLAVLMALPAVAHVSSQLVHSRYLAQRPTTPALPMRAALQVFVI